MATTITSSKIRATITVGALEIKTPYILSFNVSKKRNSTSTFTASLKVTGSDLGSLTDGKVVISAGQSGAEKTIFTGYVLASKPSPSWDDPNYVILNISGSDVLYKLQDKKFTRRQTDSESKWASINSLTREAEVGGAFKLINRPTVIMSPNQTPKDQEKQDENANKTKDNIATVPAGNKDLLINPVFKNYQSIR